MAKTLTGATATIVFTIPSLFPAPFQLQGFATDDVFDTDAIESAETQMGVDGKLSGGFVYNAVKQNYALQADSDSVVFFDQWWLTMQANQDTLTANANVALPALGTRYQMTKGFLTRYPALPTTKKLIGPRRFEITWERVRPSPT